MTGIGQEAAGALEGVRVVELASEAAAFAGKILSDLGAEVIVVEPPGGHRTRAWAPFLEDRPGPERSLWWWHYNAGKLGIVVDLDAEAGRRTFREMVRSSHVVLEGEAPGRLGALGVDYADLITDDPGLVWTSVTPFGRTSASAADPATDLTIQAGAGPVWSCGYDDHDLAPVRPGGSQAYHTGSLWAVMGTLVALHVAEAVGAGQHVDVSLYAAANVTTEAATYEWLVARAIVQRQTFRHAAVQPTAPRLMVSTDGTALIGAQPRYASEFQALIDWVLELGIAEEIDEFFFLEVGVQRGGVLVPEISSDPEAAAIYQAGADALRCVASHLPGMAFFLEAQRRGIPVGIVMAPEEILENEHFVARGFPVEVVHEDLGRTFVYPGAPFVAPRCPWQVRGRAPHLGEHTGQVLAGLERQVELP